MTCKKKWCSSFLLILLTITDICAKERLIFSVDLIRHGDRTPIHPIPKSQLYWREGLGALTVKGINQEQQLGSQLRMEYVDQYHLLPKIYCASDIYVLSTNMERTIQSANSLLLGFYPLITRGSLNKQIPIHLISTEEDNILLPSPNKNFFSFVSHYFKDWSSWNQKKIYLQPQLKKWNEITGFTLSNFKELNKLADNLYIRKLNNFPLPEDMQDSDADKIIFVSRFEIINKFKQKDVNRTLGIKFLKKIRNYLALVIENKTSLKYVLLSGHDTSIMSIMNALQLPVDTIPIYAARLNFSLMKSEKKYYVKINYNDKPLHIPVCQNNSCTLAQFDKIIRLEKN